MLLSNNNSSSSSNNNNYYYYYYYYLYFNIASLQHMPLKYPLCDPHHTRAVARIFSTEAKETFGVLGERGCKLPSGLRGRVPAAKQFSRVLSVQSGLSRHSTRNSIA